MKFTITIELNENHSTAQLPEGYSTFAELLKDKGIWCLYLSEDQEEAIDYPFWVDKVITHRDKK